jgi:hypothetical protein
MNDEPEKPGRPAETKWGSAVSSGKCGYQLVPDVLVRNQQKLGLDATDMVVLLNILMHWWERAPDKLPHPRPATIAQRIGASTRTVERHIGRLCALGLVEWLPLEPRREGPGVRRFNLQGLVIRLQAIADETEFQDIAA